MICLFVVGEPAIPLLLLKKFPLLGMSVTLQQHEDLVAASINGDLETVIRLTARPDIDVNFNRGGTTSALHCGCKLGHLAIVQHLLNHPRIDPNVLLTDLVTPFYIACLAGHDAVVDLLLANPGVDPRKRNISGNSPFLAACQSGHLNIVLRMLADPRIDINRPSNGGRSPFFEAVYEGRLEVVKALLCDPRVNINQTMEANATPLYVAAQHGRLEIAQRILASDRKIDTKTRCTIQDPDGRSNTAAEWGRRIGTFPRYQWMDDAVYNQGKVVGPVVSDLIDAFEDDPEGIRYSLRRLPNLRGTVKTLHLLRVRPSSMVF